MLRYCPDRVFDASSLNVHLGAQGVQLGLYAKAHDRLRVEVRHHRNPRPTYGARATTHEFPNYTLPELVSFLRFVGERAHERASVFFGALSSQASSPSPTISHLAMFVDKLARACGGDAVLTHRVLALLVAHGRIVRAGGPEMRAAIDSLVEAGVLVRRRSTLRGTPAVHAARPAYSAILRALREAVLREPGRRSP